MSLERNAESEISNNLEQLSSNAEQTSIEQEKQKERGAKLDDYDSLCGIEHSRDVSVLEKKDAADAGNEGSSISRGAKLDQSKGFGDENKDVSNDDKKSEVKETSNAVKDITQTYYEDARKLACDHPAGRTFTDHGSAHVEMVKNKSLEAAGAIETSVSKEQLGGKASEGRVAFEGNIDKKALEGAALSHDTGMSGHGYALAKDADGDYSAQRMNQSNFNEVRSNHSLNSAIHVLENREQYVSAGYSNEQVDLMSAECMAHSKSSSGVRDLNSKADWSDCFERMDATIQQYNTDHPDSQIWFEKGSFESDDKKLGELASSTLALRIGDVSRDSGPDAIAQSGEEVHVDRSTIDNYDGGVKEELVKADITIGENGDFVENEKSRQVHVGEQNIIENRTYANEEGKLTHEITVADGSSAPWCTQGTIKDHLGELATAKEGKFNVAIKFDENVDSQIQDIYNKMRKKAVDDFPNVDIAYPWDRERPKL